MFTRSEGQTIDSWLQGGYALASTAWLIINTTHICPIALTSITDTDLTLIDGLDVKAYISDPACHHSSNNITALCSAFIYLSLSHSWFSFPFNYFSQFTLDEHVNLASSTAPYLVGFTRRMLVKLVFDSVIYNSFINGRITTDR